MLAQRRIVIWQSILPISLIVLLAFLAYGLLIPLLGFYWDDWPLLWVVNSQGLRGLYSYNAFDRPALTILYALGYLFAGNRPLIWQLLGFGLHLVASLAFLWMVRSVWQKHKSATLVMAILFTIYPGFLQQPNSLIYTVYNFTLLLIALSIGCTVKALQAKTRIGFGILTVVATITTLCYLPLLEFFIGSEVLRLAMITIVAWRRELQLRQRISYILRYWLPSLVAMLGFLVWRFLFFTSIRRATDVGELVTLYKSNLFSSLLRIPLELISDFFDTSLFAWFAPANARFTGVSLLLFSVAVGIGIVAVVAFLAWQWWAQRNHLEAEEMQESQARRWATTTVLLSLVTLIASLLPVIISGREVALLNAYDRYTLPAMMSVCILVTATLYLMPPFLRITLLCILIGVSTGTHILNANLYRIEWKLNQALWWQLSWRIPDLAPDTVLVIAFESESIAPRVAYSIWAPANMIYTTKTEENRLLAGVILDESIGATLRQGGMSDGGMRTIDIEINYSAALVITVPSDMSCLRVIDGIRSEFPVGATALVRSVASYSRLGRIYQQGEINDAILPSVFGGEPIQSWCYYFERADLARQFGAWEQVAQIYTDAQNGGFAPQDVTEWLPFVEAFVNTGDVSHLREILDRASDEIANSLPAREMYCDAISRLTKTMVLGSDVSDAINQAAISINCP